MMNAELSYQYTYSAKDNQEVLRIRKKYLPREQTKLEQLKALDAKVKRPANLFAYLFGTIAAIIMGCGMSLVMTDIGDYIGMTQTLIPGIAIGVAGMGMALVTYPIYKGILNSRKKKYAPEIVNLSEQIMKG